MKNRKQIVFSFNLLLLLSTTLSFSAQTMAAYQTTIVVNKNGGGHYTTIREALNAAQNAPAKTIVISIKNGIYPEKLIIPKSKNKIIIIGQDQNNTRITNDDFSGKMNPETKVKYSTFSSYTTMVQADDVSISNLTIENSSCNEGQAVALHVEGNRFLMQNCTITGCQDTLLTAGDNSNQLYDNCTIEGTTDFIFGPATAVFKDCIIKSKKDSFITAASTTEAQEFGYVFLHCTLIADDTISKVYLGRPWRPFAKTVFIKCVLDASIVAEGWDPWIDNRFPNKEKTVYYAEYKSKGQGANSLNRVPWSHQLSKDQAQKYKLKNIFKKEKNWPAIVK